MESTVWEVGQKYEGWRLDRFLADKVPQLSRTRIQAMIADRITVSWREQVDPGTKVRVGGKVIAGFPRLYEVPTDFHFTVLYESTTLLAIDKPAGLVVHPTNSCRTNSLIEAIRRERGDPTLTLTHRLDRETSGVLLLAKGPQAARLCGFAFSRHQLQKTYIAVVAGSPKQDSGTISEPLGRDEASRVFVRRKIRPDGETATTHYKVVERQEGRTVLELRPETGRRHQLRVHCEFLGCPIVGDPLYGRPDEEYLEIVRGERVPGRLMLHAWKLSGRIGNEALSLEAPLPEIWGHNTHFISGDR